MRMVSVYDMTIKRLDLTERPTTIAGLRRSPAPSQMRGLACLALGSPTRARTALCPRRERWGGVEEASGLFVVRVRFRIADDAVAMAKHFAGRVRSSSICAT